MAPLKDCLDYWKKRLEQGVDEKKAIETLCKLHDVPITVELLRETRIGKVVKHLGKQPGEVGSYASRILQKWRELVEQSQEGETKHIASDKSSKEGERKSNNVSNGVHHKSYKPINIFGSNGSSENHNLSGASVPDVKIKQERSDLDADSRSYRPRESYSGIVIKKEPDDSKSNGLHQKSYEAIKMHKTNGYPESYKLSDSFSDGKGQVCDSEEDSDAYNDYNSTEGNCPVKQENPEGKYNKYLNGAKSQEYDPEYPQMNPIKRSRLELEDKSFEQKLNSSQNKSKMKVCAASNGSIVKSEEHKSHKIDASKKTDSSKSGSSFGHGTVRIKKEKHSPNHEHSVKKEHHSNKKRLHDSSEYKSKDNQQNGHDKQHHVSKKHKADFALNIKLNVHLKHSHPEDQKAESSAPKATTSSNHSRGKHEEKSHSHKSHQQHEKNKSSSKTKSPSKLKVPQAEELTASEASFEACLGLNDVVVSKKKILHMKSSKPSPAHDESPNKKKEHREKKDAKSSDKKSSKSKKDSSGSHKSPKFSVKIEGDNNHVKITDKSSSKKVKNYNVPQPASMDKVDILSTLPEIQPYYKPLPRVDFDCLPKKKAMSNEEAIIFTSSKKDRTAVYSGRRNLFSTEVPSLFDMCTRILIENLECLGYTGGVPFDLLKPVLERCTPQQLYNLEDSNPYLLEDTGEMWERHCQKTYRVEKREENETWRDMYLRCHEEKEKKLKALTANISASMCKSNPVRQVKLAYVDSVVKPPRDVARRQARHGTALPVNHVIKPGPPSKATPRPTSFAINAAVSKPPAPIPIKKPKVAPLMAKTLKAMKSAYRR